MGDKDDQTDLPQHRGPRRKMSAVGVAVQFIKHPLDHTRLGCNHWFATEEPMQIIGHLGRGVIAGVNVCLHRGVTNFRQRRWNPAVNRR